MSINGTPKMWAFEEACLSQSNMGLMLVLDLVSYSKALFGMTELENRIGTFGQSRKEVPLRNKLEFKCLVISGDG